MKTLYDEANFLLTEHADGKLLLDLKRRAKVSRQQVTAIEPVGLTYVGDETWTGHARDQAAILEAVRRLEQPRMRVLHDGSLLLLKLDGDALILDKRPEADLTPAQVRMIDRLMSPADEDCWFGDASRRHQVEALVRQIESPRVAKDPEEPWTSQAERSRAVQQRIGGR